MVKHDEIIEIYNDDYSLAGTMPRQQAQKENRWVRVSHLWIVNPKSDVVIFQKRSLEKKYFPGTLDITAAGHYKTGEEIPSGVEEMSKDLGIDISYNDLISLGIRHNIIPTPDLTVRQFCHVFFLESDKKISDFKLNLENLEGLVSIPINEGLKLWSEEMSKVEASFFDAKSKVEKKADSSRKCNS